MVKIYLLDKDGKSRKENYVDVYFLSIFKAYFLAMVAYNVMVILIAIGIFTLLWNSS